MTRVTIGTPVTTTVLRFLLLFPFPNSHDVHFTTDEQHVGLYVSTRCLDEEDVRSIRP